MCFERDLNIVGRGTRRAWNLLQNFTKMPCLASKMTPHWLLVLMRQFCETLELIPLLKILPFLYSTKITLKKTKMNWMVSCVVKSSKDNDQSTFGKEDLVKEIKIGKSSAKCQKLERRNA